jgi:hypothetical protein
MCECIKPGGKEKYKKEDGRHIWHVTHCPEKRFSGTNQTCYKAPKPGRLSPIGAKILSLESQYKLYEFSDALYSWEKHGDGVKVHSGSPPSARRYHGFAGAGNSLYVYGGCRAGESASQSERSKIFSDSHELEARCSQEVLSDFHEFDTTSNTWKSVDQSSINPGPRAFHAFAAVDDGTLYLHGGLNSSGRSIGA